MTSRPEVTGTVEAWFTEPWQDNPITILYTNLAVAWGEDMLDKGSFIQAAKELDKPNEPDS